MNKPLLIDLNNELKVLKFNKNTYDLNLFLGVAVLFLILLTYIFSKDYSKRKNKQNILKKLLYIHRKSNRYISR